MKLPPIGRCIGVLVLLVFTLALSIGTYMSLTEGAYFMAMFNVLGVILFGLWAYQTATSGDGCFLASQRRLGRQLKLSKK